MKAPLAPCGVFLSLAASASVLGRFQGVPSAGPGIVRCAGTRIAEQALGLRVDSHQTRDQRAAGDAFANVIDC